MGHIAVTSITEPSGHVCVVGAGAGAGGGAGAGAGAGAGSGTGAGPSRSAIASGFHAFHWYRQRTSIIRFM
jgi:hypothetical protein